MLLKEMSSAKISFFKTMQIRVDLWIWFMLDLTKNEGGAKDIYVSCKFVNLLYLLESVNIIMVIYIFNRSSAYFQYVIIAFFNYYTFTSNLCQAEWLTYTVQ